MIEHLRLFGQSHDLARSGVQLSRCNVSTHGSLPLLSFPTLGVLHCVSGSAVVLGLVHLSQRVLLAGYGAIVQLVKVVLQVFFRIFRTFGALHSVERSTLCKLLQCAQVPSVRVRAGACARVARLTGAFLGRSGRVLGLGWYRTRGRA